MSRSATAKRASRFQRCDPSTVDRHRVRELIREWIVYPYSTRMREPPRPGRVAPMSVIAAAPLPPQPRGNNKGEMTAPAPQYCRRKFPIVAGNITRL